MVLIKYVLWTCTECTEDYVTDHVNERPMHQHYKGFNYETGEVLVEQFAMRRVKEYWA